jgi:hypothetical protein
MDYALRNELTDLKRSHLALKTIRYGWHFTVVQPLKNLSEFSERMKAGSDEFTESTDVTASRVSSGQQLQVPTPWVHKINCYNIIYQGLVIKHRLQCCIILSGSPTGTPHLPCPLLK